MEKKARKVFLNDHVGCFGEYNSGDRLCRKLCAIRLICAIEREQNEQIELFEDMLSPDDMYFKSQ